MKRRVLIGIGSNIDPVRNVRAACSRLSEIFGDVRSSRFRWTRPLAGRIEQDKYLNGVVLVRTDVSVVEIRAVLAGVEAGQGRERVPMDAYASRTLDLDLLAVEGGENEDLPSRELIERDFNLVAAAEVWPEFIWPETGRTLAEMAAGIDIDRGV